MATDAIYNVYEIVNGAVWREEGRNTIDSARRIFDAWCASVARNNENDYGPDLGDGIYLYDTVFGNMITEWQYVS